MEVAPVAEAHGTDRALDSAKAPREQRAGHDREHGAEMADHRQDALPRAAAVDIAIAPQHRPETRAHVGAGAIEERFTESETPGLVADERSEDVAFAQGHARGGAERFLPLAEEDPAGDLAPRDTGPRFSPP